MLTLVGLIAVKLFNVQQQFAAQPGKRTKRLFQSDFFPDLLYLLDDPLADAVKQIGVGGIGDVFGLSRGIHCHPIGFDQSFAMPVVE